MLYLSTINSNTAVLNSVTVVWKSLLVTTSVIKKNPLWLKLWWSYSLPPLYGGGNVDFSWRPIVASSGFME